VEAQPYEVPWLDEARTLYAQGESMTDIAKRFDTSATSVHRAFSRNQVPRRTRTEGVTARWRALRAERITIAGETQGRLDELKAVTLNTLTHGKNGHLDRGIARIEAAIADDERRGGSAFSDGGD
jgi:hypothetical protein